MTLAGNLTAQVQSRMSSKAMTDVCKRACAQGVWLSRW